MGAVVPLLGLLLCGCGEQSAEPRGTAPEEARGSTGGQVVRVETEAPFPESIGPQFWLYDLSEYDEVEHDVRYGLGGRWISIRKRQKPGCSVTRDQLVERISKPLLAAGWTRATPPRRYVLSKMWETAAGDLYFRRPALKGEPHYLFFNQAVHISEDASIVCLYAEAGW